MKNLNYNKLETQPYLLSNKINPQVAKLLFTFRTRMVDVKENFKNKYVSAQTQADTALSCPLCLSKEDSQEHLLSCKKLNQNLVINQSEKICYSDIFSTSVEKNLIAITALEKLMKKTVQMQCKYVTECPLFLLLLFILSCNV